jgi:hypothetical protein
VGGGECLSRRESAVGGGWVLLEGLHGMKGGRGEVGSFLFFFWREREVLESGSNLFFEGRRRLVFLHYVLTLLRIVGGGLSCVGARHLGWCIFLRAEGLFEGECFCWAHIWMKGMVRYGI